MAHNSDKVLVAMKKANTSLQKVMRMVEDGKYCIDIIQQNLAVIGLLRSANSSLLEGHVNNCVKNACKGRNEKEIDAKMGELMRVIRIAQSK